MLKIYGSEMCPDCRECKKNLDLHEIPYEFIDICKSLKDLSAFLKMRDADPVFDHCKQINDIGLPALIKDDGTVFLNWEGYLKSLGYDVVYEETAPVCSIDRKGC